MDEDLTWIPHTDHIANKISKSNGVLRRLKHTIPRHILKIIYFSLINSHLNYGILLWGFNLDRIENLQKKAIRIITHSYTLAHTSNLFKQLKILKVEDIFKMKQLIFYYNFIKDTLPNPVKNILTAETRDLRTAHTATYLKPPDKPNTEAAKQCIRFSIPEFINEFGKDKKEKEFIDNLPNISILTLKTQYKNKIFVSYPPKCTEEECYPCSSRFFNPFGFAYQLKFLHIFFYMMNFKYQKLFLSSGILEFINIFNYTNNPH